MNRSTNGESWKPFKSNQRIIPRRPGFDWDARIQMFPGIAARVHDSYIAGEGILYASLWGLVSMAKASGTPELAQGELLRFIAEATLHDGTLSVTLLFRFGKDILIESMYAASRGGITKTGFEFAA